MPVSEVKCLAHWSIVATALAHGTSVVTRNTRNFDATKGTLLDVWGDI